MRLSKYMAMIVVVVLTVGLVAQATPSQAETDRSCTGWEYQVDHLTPMDVREHRMRQLIECVFTQVGIPGEVSTAWVVASRESGFAPWAYNSGSCATGLFQHICTYWDGRAQALPRDEFPRWPDSSALNPRANAWAAAEMVKAGGWGPWTTI